MKIRYGFLILACILLGCDKAVVCVYGNKDVTVFNNTGYDLSVFIKDNFNVLQVGSMKPFEIISFNVQFGVILEAGNSTFSDEVYVDPCKNDLELVVED